MKKIIIGILLFIVVFTSACNLNETISTGESDAMIETYNTDSNSEQEKYIMLPNKLIASYKNIERELYLNDFVNIKIDMTYKEIIDIIGEPNGICGSGFVLPYYELSDGTYIILTILTEDSAKLGNITILDSSGRQFKLYIPG